MGRRGPLPRSGVVYVCRDGTELDVVVRAHGAPYVHWPGHPLATSSGHVPVLRLAASEAGLGRHADGSFSPWITRGQAVTPIDGDPWNWDRKNLRVRPLAASLPLARRSPRQAPTDRR
jgi:hypothetical protein